MNTLRIVGRAEIGSKREVQEDGVGCFSEDGIAVVVDGMGGSASGEIAPQVVIPLVRRAILEASDGLTELVFDETLAEVMRGALQRANRRLVELTLQRRHTGMGATAAVAWRYGDRVVLGHVGDARVYRLREGALTLMTRDHTILEELKSAPEYADRIEEYAEYARIITRALGVADECAPDVAVHAADDGDVWMLCSDGLCQEVPHAEVERALNAATLDEAVLELVAATYARESSDNFSVVVMKGSHDPRAERPPVRCAPPDAFEAPPGLDLREVLDVVGDETDPRAAWEALATRGVIPDAWVEHPDRRFVGPQTEHAGGFLKALGRYGSFRAPEEVATPGGPDLRYGPVRVGPLLPHPGTVREVVLFATRRDAVLRAEVIAEELARRLQIRGHLAWPRTIWSVEEDASKLLLPEELMEDREWWDDPTSASPSNAYRGGPRGWLAGFYLDAQARWTDAESFDDHPYFDLPSPFDALRELLALGCTLKALAPFGRRLALLDPAE